MCVWVGVFKVRVCVFEVRFGVTVRVRVQVRRDHVRVIEELYFIFSVTTKFGVRVSYLMGQEVGVKLI